MEHKVSAKSLHDIAIDCVFDIVSDMETAAQIDKLISTTQFNTEFFSFRSLTSLNEFRLIGFLDEYFYSLLDQFNPNGENDFDQGIVSYTLYDAATPYIDDKPYFLKDKEQFKAYVKEILSRKAKLDAKV